MSTPQSLAAGEIAAPSGSPTDPRTIPADVAKKLLLARDSILGHDQTPSGMRSALNDVYHQLYAIADPNFEHVKPWEVVESVAAAPPTPESRTRTVLRSMLASLDDGDDGTYFECFDLLQKIMLEVLESENSELDER